MVLMSDSVLGLTHIARVIKAMSCGPWAELNTLNRYSIEWEKSFHISQLSW